MHCLSCLRCAPKMSSYTLSKTIPRLPRRTLHVLLPTTPPPPGPCTAPTRDSLSRCKCGKGPGQRVPPSAWQRASPDVGHNPGEPGSSAREGHHRRRLRDILRPQCGTEHLPLHCSEGSSRGRAMHAAHPRMVSGCGNTAYTTHKAPGPVAAQKPAACTWRSQGSFLNCRTTTPVAGC